MVRRRALPMLRSRRDHGEARTALHRGGNQAARTHASRCHQQHDQQIGEDHKRSTAQSLHQCLHFFSDLRCVGTMRGSPCASPICKNGHRATSDANGRVSYRDRAESLREPLDHVNPPRSCCGVHPAAPEMNTNSFNRTLTALRLSELASTFPVSDDGLPVSSPSLVAGAVKRATALTVIQIDASGCLLGSATMPLENPANDAHQTAKAVADVLLPSAVSVVVARPERPDVTFDQEARFAMILACRLELLGVSLIDYILLSPSGSQRYSMASSGAV